MGGSDPRQFKCPPDTSAQTKFHVSFESEAASQNFEAVLVWFVSPNGLDDGVTHKIGGDHIESVVR